MPMAPPRAILRCRVLPGHRLLLTLALDVALLGLEELADLISQLGRVLVAVDRHRMVGRGGDHLILLANDRERAVRLARPAPAVCDLSSHPTSLRDVFIGVLLPLPPTVKGRA